MQGSGGLSYLAASVRRFRSGTSAAVGNPFFRHLPPLDWLDAAFDSQKKKAKPNPQPVLPVANMSSSTMANAGGRHTSSGGSSRRRHDGGGGGTGEEKQGEVQTRLRDALWMAPREQASAEAAASFTRPRVWKVLVTSGLFRG